MNATQREMIRTARSTILRSEFTEPIPLEQDMFERMQMLEAKLHNERTRLNKRIRRVEKERDEWGRRAREAERTAELLRDANHYLMGRVSALLKQIQAVP